MTNQEFVDLADGVTLVYQDDGEKLKVVEIFHERSENSPSPAPSRDEFTKHLTEAIRGGLLRFEYHPGRFIIRKTNKEEPK